MGSEEGENMDLMPMDTPISVTCKDCGLMVVGTIATCQQQTIVHCDETGHIYFVVTLQVME